MNGQNREDSMDLKELQKLTVTKLREMAMEYEDITDASGMTKV